jgi:hypothetical protein
MQALRYATTEDKAEICAGLKAGTRHSISACSAAAAGITINSGIQNGQICAAFRTDQGSETSTSADEVHCAPTYLCPGPYADNNIGASVESSSPLLFGVRGSQPRFRRGEPAHRSLARQAFTTCVVVDYIELIAGDARTAAKTAESRHGKAFRLLLVTGRPHPGWSTPCGSLFRSTR